MMMVWVCLLGAVALYRVLRRAEKPPLVAAVAGGVFFFSGYWGGVETWLAGWGLLALDLERPRWVGMCVGLALAGVFLGVGRAAGGDPPLILALPVAIAVTRSARRPPPLRVFTAAALLYSLYAVLTSRFESPALLAGVVLLAVHLPTRVYVGLMVLWVGVIVYRGNDWIEHNLVENLPKFGETQALAIEFSPDVTLVGLAQDGSSSTAGGVLHLRLDWELRKLPDAPLYFQFNALDFQQASYGSAEQLLPMDERRVTTYHAIFFNPETPPGLYTVLLRLGYEGGTLAEKRLTTVKIPTENIPAQPALAVFTDGRNRAELLSAVVETKGEQIEVILVWRAAGRFAADYTVFVHLTQADDPTPLLQADSYPMAGRYPTSIWDIGDKITDIHVFNTELLPPGSYVIRVGFYHPEYGRLGDSFILETGVDYLRGH